jgi:hypothetical protein
VARQYADLRYPNIIGGKSQNDIGFRHVLDGMAAIRSFPQNKDCSHRQVRLDRDFANLRKLKSRKNLLAFSIPTRLHDALQNRQKVGRPPMNLHGPRKSPRRTCRASSIEDKRIISDDAKSAHRKRESRRRFARATWRE